jgi:hypothetical protein
MSPLIETIVWVGLTAVVTALWGWLSWAKWIEPYIERTMSERE